MNDKNKVNIFDAALQCQWYIDLPDSSSIMNYQISVPATLQLEFCNLLTLNKNYCMKIAGV
jgi:hypothetical protein